MPTNKNKKEKRDKKSKKSKRKDTIQMLMEVLPQQCDSDSSDNEAERQQPASRQKNSQRDKSNLRRTNFANGLLGEANPSKARAKDIPGIPTIPNLWQAEDASMDEWRRNNSCFLDMHIGHAARDHKLSRKEWDGPLRERGIAIVRHGMRYETSRRSRNQKTSRLPSAWISQSGGLPQI